MADMALPTLYTLKKRRSFVAARTKGQSIAGRNIVLQLLPSTHLVEDIPLGTIPVGFTATKKIGNAVTRNRAKRRLRALIADTLPDNASPQSAYIFIARYRVLTTPYSALEKELSWLLRQVTN